MDELEALRQRMAAHEQTAAALAAVARKMEDTLAQRDAQMAASQQQLEEARSRIAVLETAPDAWLHEMHGFILECKSVPC